MTGEVSFDHGAVCKTALVLTVLKLSVGVTLLVCAILGVQNTKDDRDGFGPPYYVGGFVCGPLLLIGCLLDGCVMKKAKNIDADSQSDRSAFRSAVVPESAFAVLAMFGCFPGFFCVGWGVKSCEVETDSFFHSTCNYTINVEQNRRLAIIILVCLLLTVFLGIFTLFFVCCSPMLLGVRDACRRDGIPFAGRRLPRHGVVVVQNTYMYGDEGGARQGGTGVHSNVTYHPTTTAYMTDTTTSGAPFGTSPTAGGGVHGNADSDAEAARMKRLEEENRLLREQLELRQQLGQPQQPQPQPYYAGPAVPPPSYSDIVTQPEKDDHFAPSAPPM